MRGKSRRRKRAKKARGAPFPRLGWTRSPVQRPHSTKKGKRGYCRRRSREELRREARDAGRA